MQIRGLVEALVEDGGGSNDADPVEASTFRVAAEACEAHRDYSTAIRVLELMQEWAAKRPIESGIGSNGSRGRSRGDRKGGGSRGGGGGGASEEAQAYSHAISTCVLTGQVDLAFSLVKQVAVQIPQQGNGGCFDAACLMRVESAAQELLARRERQIAELAAAADGDEADAGEVDLAEGSEGLAKARADEARLRLESLLAGVSDLVLR